MKRISKCLSWGRVYWQVPGQARSGGQGRGWVVNSVREPWQGRSRGAADVDGEGVLGAIVGSQESGGGGTSCRLPESG